MASSPEKENFLWKVIAAIAASLTTAMVIGWFTIARDTQRSAIQTRETITLIRTEQLNVLRRLLIIEDKLERGVDDRYRAAEARRDFSRVAKEIERLKKSVEAIRRHTHSPKTPDSF